MARYAENLAKDYELGNTKEDFYNYILDSLINGQRSQVRSLFNSMKVEDKHDFLINFLEDDNGIQKSCKNVCIGELK